jgi:anthranilate synthase/aminodeoxychorismate synthase-like glutamine amidotransferase
MHLLMIDNYDSFTYNLVHQLRELEQEVTVVRNDDHLPADLPEFDALVLSPGPGIPAEAGNLLPTIQHFAGRKPILGICLGHQAIAESFGGSLFNLPQVYHGVGTPIHVHPDPIFEDLEARVEVGRYHSWVVKEDEFPSELEVIARDDNGQIMALRHRTELIYGFQFHPESILTPDGTRMIRNFLALSQSYAQQLPHFSTLAEDRK